MRLPPTEEIREAIEKGYNLRKSKLPESSKSFRDYGIEIVRCIETVVSDLISIGALKEEQPVDVVGLEKELRETKINLDKKYEKSESHLTQIMCSCKSEFIKSLLYKYFPEEGK